MKNFKTRKFESEFKGKLHLKHFSDVNECAAHPCPVGSICSNTPGSYRCSCSDGFLFDFSLGRCSGDYFHILTQISAFI